MCLMVEVPFEALRLSFEKIELQSWSRPPGKLKSPNCKQTAELKMKQYFFSF